MSKAPAPRSAAAARLWTTALEGQARRLAFPAPDDPGGFARRQPRPPCGRSPPQRALLGWSMASARASTSASPAWPRRAPALAPAAPARRPLLPRGRVARLAASPRARAPSSADPRPGFAARRPPGRRCGLGAPPRAWRPRHPAPRSRTVARARSAGGAVPAAGARCSSAASALRQLGRAIRRGGALHQRARAGFGLDAPLRLLRAARSFSSAPARACRPRARRRASPARAAASPRRPCARAPPPRARFGVRASRAGAPRLLFRCRSLLHRHRGLRLDSERAFACAAASFPSWPPRRAPSLSRPLRAGAPRSRLRLGGSRSSTRRAALASPRRAVRGRRSSTPRSGARAQVERAALVAGARLRHLLVALFARSICSRSAPRSLSNSLLIVFLPWRGLSRQRAWPDWQLPAWERARRRGCRRRGRGLGAAFGAKSRLIRSPSESE